MTTLNLTPEQSEILKEILTSSLSDLRMEIVDTDNSEFREILKKRKAILKSIIAQFDES